MTAVTGNSLFSGTVVNVEKFCGGCSSLSDSSTGLGVAVAEPRCLLKREVILFRVGFLPSLFVSEFGDEGKDGGGGLVSGSVIIAIFQLVSNVNIKQ